jgi:succinyl-CoA synthetase beta subunit
MKIHEYQAKEILRQFAVPTPRGNVCFSVDEAESWRARQGWRCESGALID